MIERIIILMERRFDQRTYHSFGIKTLKENGFQVEVWDLTDVLHPDYARKVNHHQDFQFDELVTFTDKEEMSGRLSRLTQKDFVINYISYVFWNLGVYQALSRSRAQYAVSYANAVPIYKGSRMNMLKERFKHFLAFERPTSKFLQLRKKLFMRLPYQLLGVKPASLILAGGNRCFINRYPIDKNKSDILRIHSFDYDRYLEARNEVWNEKSQAVFIDEFLPYSHDLYFEGRNILMDVGEYRALLKKFFDLVEENTGLEVVIAADPRSTYDEHPVCFGGRKCLRGKTRVLVRESRLVLAHRSTAVSFANLYNKPVIFITCLDLNRTFDGRQIREMAKWFGKTTIFMENGSMTDWEKELMVSQDDYTRYRQGYIKAEGSEDLLFWQVVANKIKQDI